MRTIAIVLLLHVAAIVVLAVCGFWLNDLIKEHADRYQGLIAIFSGAFGAYSFLMNLLYHKSARFHLFVNRLLLQFRRAHTYWLPSFDFELAEQPHTRNIFDTIESSFWSLPHKTHRRVDNTPTSVTFKLDNILCFVARLQDNHLHVTWDRKALVPSQLYDAYTMKLSRLAQSLFSVLKPESVRLGIEVSFDDGVANPYYGFFVRSVPAQTLRHFEASYVLDDNATCRVEAHTDNVTIEGTDLVEFFGAVSQVLALQALPGGASQP
jgi:hypothetical protein